MSALRQAILPAFLFLCIVLGGSSQAVWANAVLQSLAVGILAWAALVEEAEPLSPVSRRLGLIIAGLAMLFVVQLVPLPPAIWSAIPGRDFIVRGFSLLGMQLPWLPISIARYDTLSAALTLLPPAALLFGMLRLRNWTTEGMFIALLLAAAVSIMLGVLQVAGGVRWYFYERTNIGVAVGTFANGNHFSTLLLVAMPVLCALAVGRRRAAKTKQKRAFAGALAMVGAAVLAVGLLICRSASMLLIGPPVFAATIAMVFRLPKRGMRNAILGIGAVVAASAAVLTFAGNALPNWGTGASIETRKQFWATSFQAAEDQALTGWGFGTFQQAYRRFEDPSKVDRFYVNHAHSDYLEIAVEGGIPAIVLTLIFLIWWYRRSSDGWLAPGATLEQKAAAVASAAILLHSIFDYPLRTAAISGIFAMCLALLAGAKGAGRRDVPESEKARHATL